MSCNIGLTSKLSFSKFLNKGVCNTSPEKLIYLTYLIFRVTSAALIRGRRLFKNCTRQINFFYIFFQRYTFYLLIFVWTDTKLIVNLEIRIRAASGCGALIQGRRLLTFLSQMRRLIEGGAYSSEYGKHKHKHKHKKKGTCSFFLVLMLMSLVLCLSHKWEPGLRRGPHESRIGICTPNSCPTTWGSIVGSGNCLEVFHTLFLPLSTPL